MGNVSRTILVSAGGLAVCLPTAGTQKSDVSAFGQEVPSLTPVTHWVHPWCCDGVFSGDQAVSTLVHTWHMPWFRGPHPSFREASANTHSCWDITMSFKTSMGSDHCNVD